MKSFTTKKILSGKIAVAALILGLISTLSTAQEKSQFLSLKEAIEVAVSNNSAMQSGKIDEAIAREKYKQANAGFLPQINFSYSAFVTDNALNAFGFRLQQREVAATDFNPDLLNHPSRTTDFSTRLEARQPLFNLDAIYIKESAKAQAESHQFKTKRTLEYLTLETQKAYYQLQMAHRVVSVLEEALSTAESVYQFTNNRVVQGLIQESDLLNVGVQVLGIESSLNEAKSNLLSASDYLSVLMNRPTGVLYQTEEMENEYPGDRSFKLSENRSDFLAMEQAIAATSLMVKASKMKFVPRLNAFGYYQWDDREYNGFRASSYFAGVQLSWNIFDGNSNRRQAAGLRLEQQKLDLQLRTLKQENQMQLDKHHRDLANSLFKIEQQNAAVAQSEEALRIIQNRYEEGLVNTTDVLNAQTQLSQQKLMLLQAVFANHVTQANIQFLTTTDSQQQ